MGWIEHLQSSNKRQFAHATRLPLKDKFVLNHIGDLVEVEARMAFTGNTSMNISVEVRSGDMKSGQMQKTTECLIVFVSVDSHGRPIPATPFTPESPQDVDLAQRAKAHLEAARNAS